ncbi:hypothetical protein HFD88_007030 [Aspergillus terreus]|nr:hypothetical protein HFD88_007030 [Aspergillus terreus]
MPPLGPPVKKEKRFFRRLRAWVRRKAFPGASRRPQPLSIPPPDRNAFALHAPSTPPSPDYLPSPSPPRRPSREWAPITLRSAPQDSVTADDSVTALDSVTPWSSMDPSPAFTSNDASMMSPADQTTAATTPLRPSCPGSPRELLDDGETTVSPPWEDNSKADYVERPIESFRRDTFFIGADFKMIPMRMSLDTQSTFSIVAKDKLDRLNVRMEMCDEMISTLAGGPKTEVPVEGRVQLSWHFLNGKKTYTTTFRVVDMTDYDVLLGHDAILEHGLMQLSDQVPGVVRCPGR